MTNQLKLNDSKYNDREDQVPETVAEEDDTSLSQKYSIFAFVKGAAIKQLPGGSISDYVALDPGYQ